MIATDSKAREVSPGIFYDLPAEDYFAIEALSNSGAGQILKTPAHYLYSRTAIDDDTKEKLRGTAAHAAILQPEDFGRLYVCGPGGDGRTKEFKLAWAECEKHFLNHFILRAEEYDKVRAIRQAVWSHPIARKLLECQGPSEASFVWKDSDTGAMCKARMDKLALAKNVNVDLKCLRDIRPNEFSMVMHARGYHRQGAVYQHATAARGISCDMTAFICVENEPPHGVIVYQLEDEAIERGWADFRRAMEIYARCVESGQWPGYPIEIQSVGLPTWAYRETNLTGD